jgi:FkbM family methyltransferase
MISLLDRKLPDNRSASDVLFAALDRTQDELTFVDVGARNGSYLLPASYAQRACIIGFEPNQVEYERLVAQKTEASAAGMQEHKFRRRRYFSHALWSTSGRRSFYEPIAPGAATLVGWADPKMTQNIWLSVGGGASYYDRIQRPKAVGEVECQTLDRMWAPEPGLIDILKLDVEGGEVDVLEGARGLLTDHRILLIRSEFALAPYYENRPTFGHQQVLLNELGYRAIALEFEHWQYCWKPTDVMETNDRWLTRSGDAVFVLDPDRNHFSVDQFYRLGLACVALGFNAFGLNLIREAGAINDSDLRSLVAVMNTKSKMRKAREVWMGVPDRVYRILHRMKLR